MGFFWIGRIIWWGIPTELMAGLIWLFTDRNIQERKNLRLPFLVLFPFWFFWIKINRKEMKRLGRHCSQIDYKILQSSISWINGLIIFDFFHTGQLLRMEETEISILKLGSWDMTINNQITELSDHKYFPNWWLDHFYSLIIIWLWIRVA